MVTVSDIVGSVHWAMDLGYVLLLLLAAVIVWILRALSGAAESYELTPRTAIYRGTGDAERKQIQVIPQYIWSYWHSESQPQVATKCMNNWRTLNPKFQINMLHAGNVCDFITERKLPDNFHELVHQHQADWVRLALLEQYGGIWLDSSILLTAPLDWVISKQGQAGVEYVGFDIDEWRVDESKRPVIENWFMASTKSSSFIRAWTEEFTLALEDGPKYLADLKQQGIYEETVQKIMRPQYFLMHVCAQRALQKNNECKLLLIKGASSAFFYLNKADGRLTRLFWRLLFLRAPESLPALIKLRGRERRKLEKFLSYGLYRNRSIVGMYLMKNAAAR